MPEVKTSQDPQPIKLSGTKSRDQKGSRAKGCHVGLLARKKISSQPRGRNATGYAVTVALNFGIDVWRNIPVGWRSFSLCLCLCLANAPE